MRTIDKQAVVVRGQDFPILDRKTGKWENIPGYVVFWRGLLNGMLVCSAGVPFLDEDSALHHAEDLANRNNTVSIEKRY